ncbi:hypothetical protein V5O48_004218 [Marasmius crinis-equi]|uniref:Uncharacterized protein n=1 Tax=Marasmius crinis-equi TaxID=585013 RepID=A0ABR3FR11_9AGAR
MDHLTPVRLVGYESFVTRACEQPIVLRLEGVVNSRWDAQFDLYICRFLARALPRVKELRAPLKFFWSFDFRGTLSLPSLECLAVRSDSFSPGRGEAFSKSQVEAVLSAPSLTKLQLASMQWYQMDIYPTSRLTSLECWIGMNMGELVRPGTACPELKAMKIVVFDSRNENVDQPLLFPSLVSLDILSKLAEPPILLDRMMCPSLVTFAYATSKSDGRPNVDSRDVFVTSLIACVQRSQCTLRSFSLSLPHDILPSDHEWLQELLLISASVKSLGFTMRLESRGVDLPTLALYHLWSLLTIPSPIEGSVLLPRLDTVKMRVDDWTYAVNGGCHPGDLNRDIVGRFIKMAESRGRIAAPLHIATLRRAELVLLRTFQGKDAPEEDAAQRAMAHELNRRREVLVNSGMNCTIEEVLNERPRKRWGCGTGMLSQSLLD